MSVLLVVSDSVGAGKSAVTLALAAIANRDGRSARVFRPFSSDDDHSDSLVFAQLANPGLEGWPRPVRDDGLDPGDIGELSAAFATEGGDEPLTILELLSSVGPEDVTRAADMLDAKVLVVAAGRRDLRGNDLSGWSDAVGDRLLGVLINGVTRYLGTEAAEVVSPSFEAAGIQLVGMIPEDRSLLALTVEQVRVGLEGRYVVDEGDTDGPLEWFQVGGLSLDPGELRFGLYENSAAVIRGDRPDVQMSALNGSVSCLILTGGIDPIEYISYEAQEEETPVMVVEPDTLTTMSLLNDVTSSAQMDTTAKISRFCELLEAHADLNKIWANL